MQNIIKDYPDNTIDYRTFKERFGVELNDQQEAALTNVDGQTLLLAVPGSGKTTTLVCRVGYMIYVKGISLAKILVLTFTRAAARDMQQRFISIFGDEYAKQVRFRTINSLCEYILNRYCKVKGHRKPELIDDNYAILFRLYQNCYDTYPAESDIKNMQLAITRAKNLRLSESEIRKIKVDGQKLEPLYNAYQKYLRAKGVMDFDDQLVLAYGILAHDGQFLSYIQEMNPYLLVDEAQDTSKIQHDIINLVAARHRRIFMVGDEDQSIYGFRAAYPDALMHFGRIYPDAWILKLEQNYRSTPEIVKLANTFIKQNKNRFTKKMFTERQSANKIRFLKLKKREDQYHAIVHRLLPLYEGQTAVIYRNNESAIPLIAELMKAGVSFRCRGMDTVFFGSRVVTDLKKIMQSALDPQNAELFMETYSLFDAHISKVAASNAASKADAKSQSSIWYTLYFGDEVSQNYRAEVKMIAQEMAAIRENNNAKDAIDRICAMGYKKAADDRVFILRTLAEDGETIESFIERLGELEQAMPEASYDNSIPYILSTVHYSKGLEYDNVIIMDEISPVWPDVRVDAEEERRLFYVAMTRAKNNLTLLSYGNERQPFIDSMGRISKPMHHADTSSQTSTPHSRIRRIPRYDLNPGSSDSGSHENADTGMFRVGADVRHKSLGAGTITSVDGDVMKVTFADTGETKKYSISICKDIGVFEFD